MYYRLIDHSVLASKSLRDNTIQITFSPYSKALAYFILLLFYKDCKDVIGPRSNSQTITIQNIVDIEFLTPSLGCQIFPSFFFFFLQSD